MAHFFFKKKYFCFIVVIFLFFFYCSNFNTSYSYSANITNEEYNNRFFKLCKLKNEDEKLIKYVLFNSNEKYIPNNIDDISNDTFKKALYLNIYYLYAKNKKLPKGLIKMIGFDDISKLKAFSLQIIDYMIDENYDYNKIIKYIEETTKLSHSEIKKLLFNKKFINLIQNNIDNVYTFNFISKSLFNILSNIIISYDDIKELKSVYDKFFNDEMILQQVRLRLWKKNTNNIERLIKLLRNDINKKHCFKLLQFYNHQFLKKVNKNRHIHTEYNCHNLFGYDEYIDLYCLAKKKNDKKYVEKVLLNNNNPIFLPDKWVIYRFVYVRDNIDNVEKYNVLYEVISNAGQLDGSDYFKQQFLSGFISFLSNKLISSLEHFLNCKKYVKHDEELAKTNYWISIVYDKLGDESRSQLYLKESAKYFMTLYGQIAIEKLYQNNNELENVLIKNIKQQSLDINDLCNDVLFITSYINQNLDDSRLSNIFKEYADINYKNNTKLFTSLNIFYNDFDIKIGIAYAKYLKRYNVMLNDLSYPIIDEKHDSLINAIIQRESNFNSKAISNKGARGMMQIMPETGRNISKTIGLKYSHKRLLNDKNYNITLGKFYLDQLLKKFNNHKVLSLASYNAGSGNINKWINRFGDPRNMDNSDDVLIWIEKIPFSQTRDYVIKILGAEMMYEVIKNNVNKK